MRASIAIGFGAVLALALGCGGDTYPVRVDVRTDWVPTDEFDEVEIAIEGGATAYYEPSLDDDFVSGVRVATFDAVAPGTYTARVRLEAGSEGRRVAQRRVQFMVRDGGVSVTVLMSRGCESVTCPPSDDPEATECLNGGCVPPTCSPEDPDACGSAGCEADEECPAPLVGCARSLCVAGECFVGTEFSACGVTEYCHPEMGCVPRPTGGSDAGMSMMDGGPPTVDAGPDPSCGQPCDLGEGCATGVYDCSEGAPVCVRDALLPEGTECRAAAGPCDVAETCDGANAACPMDAFAPTGTSCAAGFCDGLGTCSSGCTPGAPCSPGDPCKTGTIDCSGGSPSCMVSGNVTNGTSCGATQTGSWGSCGGFSGTCDETGTRTRSVTTYTCQAGSCDPNTSSETGACSRSTTGTTCAATENGSWSSCGGFSNACDESGTRSRSVTTHTCASGSCGSTTTTQNGSCSRSTDGASCGSVTYGSWSACGGFSNGCDESGTQSRDVYTPVCGSGSCGMTTTTQSRSCTRNTDGNSCGSTVTGTWGSCSYGSTCAESGTRERTDTLRQCVSGACSDVPTVVTGTCTRDTDGTDCGGFGCEQYQCTSGSCQLVFQCPSTWTCCGDTCSKFACP